MNQEFGQLRIHLLGASGSGTTSLGIALARKLQCAHIDVDSIFWVPSYPPYKEYRPKEERRTMLLQAVKSYARCVISGSACGWGDPIIPLLDLVVFMYVPTEERLDRLRGREIEHFGEVAIRPGGDVHENFVKFMDWAAGYDAGGVEMRSLKMHEDWLHDLSCPVIRLEGVMPPEAQLDEILRALNRL